MNEINSTQVPVEPQSQSTKKIIGLPKPVMIMLIIIIIFIIWTVLFFVFLVVKAGTYTSPKINQKNTSPLTNKLPEGTYGL